MGYSKIVYIYILHSSIMTRSYYISIDGQGVFCGNYKVESGEMCDDGPVDAISNLKTCCGTDCQLLGQSICRYTTPHG